MLKTEQVLIHVFRYATELKELKRKEEEEEVMQNQKLVFPCQMCDQTFDLRIKLNVHAKKMHKSK